MVNDSRADEDLEAPDNLGAPAAPAWGPGVRRGLYSNWRAAHGGESARLVLLAVLAGIPLSVVVLLLVHAVAG